MKVNHYRVCQDRSNDDLEDLGFLLGLRINDKRFAISKVVENDIKYNFRKSSKYAVSRYGDGSWPVLYSATEPDTAISEVAFHAREEWAKTLSSFASKNFTTNKILYDLEVDCSCQKKLRASKKLTAPKMKDYPHCHGIARNAKKSGHGSINVPSARRKVGRCVPIFNDSIIKSKQKQPSKAFTLSWNESVDEIYHNLAGSPKKIEIWQKDPLTS